LGAIALLFGIVQGIISVIDYWNRDPKFDFESERIWEGLYPTEDKKVAYYGKSSTCK